MPLLVIYSIVGLAEAQLIENLSVVRSPLLCSNLSFSASFSFSKSMCPDLSRGAYTTNSEPALVQTLRW